MWIIAAYQQTHGPSRLAWFEGWWPSRAQSAFIKWTGELSQSPCHDDSTINNIAGISIIIIIKH